MKKPEAIRTVRAVTEQVIARLHRAPCADEHAKRTQLPKFDAILRAHAEAIIAAFNEPAVPLPPSSPRSGKLPPYDPAPGSLTFLSHEP